jgi:hypothetical protein
MKKLIFIIPLLFIQLIPVRFWGQCQRFLDTYHFSLYDLELQLIYAINHDYELPIFLARVFHNKLVQFFLDIFKRYTHFFDIQLFFTAITLVGLFGYILAIWYFLIAKKKDLRIAILILISVITPLIEVLFNPDLPFLIKFISIFLPFHLLSIFGHYNFIKKNLSKKILVFLVYLVLISITMLGFLEISKTVSNYCVKI